MRDLEDHPGAVTGLEVPSDRAAMDEVLEDLNAVANDLMGPASVDLDDKTDSARVVFLTRMIKPLSFHDLPLKFFKQCKGIGEDIMKANPFSKKTAMNSKKAVAKTIKSVKPVAKDTNKTRRSIKKPTKGSIYAA